MSKLNPRTVLSWVLYFVGDLVSRPMMRYDWAWLYPPYSSLMRWSSDLDKENAVWGPPTCEEAGAGVAKLEQAAQKIPPVLVTGDKVRGG